MQTCKGCEFWYPSVIESQGSCRRHEPAMDPVCLYARWPVTWSEYGCGDGRPLVQPERWVAVNVMGHQRYAGRLMLDYSTGTALIKIQIPAVEHVKGTLHSVGDQPSRWMVEVYQIPEHASPLLGVGAIFDITDVSKQYAKFLAKQYDHHPVDWQATDIQYRSAMVDGVPDVPVNVPF